MVNKCSCKCSHKSKYKFGITIDKVKLDVVSWSDNARQHSKHEFRRHKKQTKNEDLICLFK